MNNFKTKKEAKAHLCDNLQMIAHNNNKFKVTGLMWINCSNPVRPAIQIKKYSNGYGFEAIYSRHKRRVKIKRTGSLTELKRYY